MFTLPFPRAYLIAAVLAFAVFGWLIVIGIIVVDSVIVPPATPTPVNSTVPSTRVAVIQTATQTATKASTVRAAPTATVLPPTLISTEVFVEPSIEPSVTSTDSPTAEASNSSTAMSTGNNVAANGCKIPTGWVAYSIEEGDTLFGFVLGSKGALSVDSIMAANCLTTKFLAVGQTVFLPPGVSDQSPKVDNASPPILSDSGTNPDGSLPAANASRSPKCPCTISVRAGWRLEQIAAAVDAVPVSFSGADFMATVVARAATPDLPVLSSRPSGSSLEGFMFPGSYALENSTSAVQFRDMMLNAFAANVGGQVQADAAARGMTFWEAVVLASIIQKESGAPSEQVLIGSVFHNRLSQNKGLAATVTLQYALGGPGNWWPRVRSVNFKSPYNTYIYAGLPPSPIASPGLSAIMAAIYPAQTNYLYFSGKCGGGGNFYAATYAEFEQGLKCN